MYSFMFQFIQQIVIKCLYLTDIVLHTKDEMVKIQRILYFVKFVNMVR